MPLRQILEMPPHDIVLQSPDTVRPYSITYWNAPNGVTQATEQIGFNNDYNIYFERPLPGRSLTIKQTFDAATDILSNWSVKSMRT